MVCAKEKIEDQTPLLFMEDIKTAEIFRQIIEVIPEENDVYIVGWAVRNSLFYLYHKTKLPQRDFDVVIVWMPEKLIQNLKNIWFTEGSNIKGDCWIILKKAKIDNPEHLSDFVYLDCTYWKDGVTMEKNLKEHANLTINCNAMNIKDVFDKNWLEKVVSVNGWIEDIKDKILKINSYESRILFACLRFMSQWFIAPKKDELIKAIQMLQSIDRDRYERNVLKLESYVWGREIADVLLKRLWVEGDLFDRNEIKNLKIK